MNLHRVTISIVKFVFETLQLALMGGKMLTNKSVKLKVKSANKER